MLRCTRPLVAVFLLLSASTTFASAQSFSALWPLSAGTTITGSATGAVSASDQALGPGTPATMSILNYFATGQKLTAGNTGWIAGPEDPTRYVQFDVVPDPSTTLSVGSVSFEYGAAAMAGVIEANVRYSVDGWATSTLLNQAPLQYQQNSLAVFSQSISVSVPAGQTFSLRILPYAVQNGAAAVPIGPVHNSVRIAGETAPVTTGECVAAPSGLIGWWAGDDSAQDLSGAGNHGTYAGNYTPGRVDAAFSLTAGGPTVSAPHSPQFAFAASQGFSVDFWMRTEVQGYQVVMSKLGVSNPGFWIYLADGGYLYVNPRTTGTGGVNAGVHAPQLTDGNWHFVSVSVNPASTTGLRIRVDNGPVTAFDATSFLGGSFATTESFLLGRKADDATSLFTGQIDEVEVFDHALSDEELLAIYSAGAAGKCKEPVVTDGTLIAYKYEDIDGSGNYSAGEPFLSGVMVTVYQNGVPFTAPLQTDANGRVTFSLPAGTYEVRETVPSGFVQTEPVAGFYTVTITAGGTSVVNFGNQREPLPTTGSIEGLKYLDADQDGTQDAGEVGLGGVTILLFDGFQLVNSTVTAADGTFSFGDLEPGSYVVGEQIPDGYFQTEPDDGLYVASVTAGTAATGLVFGNAVEPNGECVPPPEGMAGWWTGNQTGADLSGRGSNASNPFNLVYTSGRVEQAFSISGPSSIVRIPDATHLDPGTSSFSIDFWFRTTTYTEFQPLVSKSDGTTGYMVYLDDGIVVADVRTSLSQFVTVSSTAGVKTDGNWHFVSLSVDRSTPFGMRLTVDGHLDSGNTSALASGNVANSTPLLIGGYTLPNNVTAQPMYFAGDIDEVEFFDRALTQVEFNAIRQAGRAGKCQDAPGVIEGTKFEDTDGDGVRDAGEPGLANVQILVHGIDGQYVKDGLTSSMGTFSIELDPGTYVITEVSPAGYAQTAPVGGSFEITVGPGTLTGGLLFGNQPIVIGECLSDLPPDMVGWWRAQDDATDFTGLGNDGVLQGSATYAPGKVGNAFSLQAATDFVRVPDDPTLDFGAGEDLSIDAWVRTLNRTEIVQIVDKRAHDFFGTHGYTLSIANGQLLFQMGDTPNGHVNFVSTGPIVADGEWHFVAVTLDRNSKTGLRMFVDNHPVQVFDPTGRQGSLENDADLLIGRVSSGLGSPVTAFRGGIDELEIFRRALSDAEIASIRDAGAFGKCIDGVGGQCDIEVTKLPVNTGVDHTTGSEYAVGGSDAFWTVTADPDPSRVVPRPADVLDDQPGMWGPAAGSSSWIGPAPFVPFTGDFNAAGQHTKAGVYTYALEFCITGEAARELTFDLALLADNAATVWLVDLQGTRTLVGSTGQNPYVATTLISQNLSGTFLPGTYRLEVDVTNYPSSTGGDNPTGFNLVGTIKGASLYMQRHECCNNGAKITGMKFIDRDGDGVYDPGQDPPQEGVTIVLIRDGVEFSVTTDAAGVFAFEGAPGTYKVVEDVPPGYTQTYPADGAYEVVVGPGEIASHIDFGNAPDACLTAGVQWLCQQPGGRYAAVTVTNNTTVAVSGIGITSSTPGVTFAIINTPTYPLAPGGSVVLHLVPTGLAAGQTADLVINMAGPRDASGMSESCCMQRIQVRRPGKLEGPFCLHYVDGTVLTDVATGGPMKWVVRAVERSGMQYTTDTNSEGYYVLEGLEAGAYDVSVDTPWGWSIREPKSGPHSVMLDDRLTGTTLDFVMTTASHTAVDDAGIPTEYVLEPNYPNPFNPVTTIRYAIPHSGPVRLDVYDMLGRPITTLVDTEQAAGWYEVPFDARDLASGMYLYRITAGSFAVTRRMVLMK